MLPCKGGRCHDLPACEQESRCLYKSSAEEAREVLEARNEVRGFARPLVPERASAEAVLRKQQPVCTGVFDYFPDALLEVAHCSQVGNDQHNPGQPLHWARGKSTDEADALLRHMLDRGKLDTDGVRHSAKVAWRALAMLQKEIESEQAAPSLPRGVKL